MRIIKNTLIKLKLVVLLILLPTVANAQSYIYKGKYANYSDIMMTFDGEHVYRGRYTNYNDIILTWDGEHIYKGAYKNFSNIIYTVKGYVPIALLIFLMYL